MGRDRLQRGAFPRSVPRSSLLALCLSHGDGNRCHPMAILCIPLSHNGHEAGDKDSPGDPSAFRGPCPRGRGVLGMLAVGFAPS